MPEPRHRVVVVGAGFGGLFAARALRRAPVEVTVVDRTNHHLFQPLLYQVATGVLSEGDIAPPTRDILRHSPNTTVLIGDVVHIDLAHHEIVIDTIGRRTTVPFDSLLDAGGTILASFPGSLQRSAHRDLDRLGVEVWLSSRVVGVDLEGLDIERADATRDRIDAFAKIWAAGVQASPLGATLAAAAGIATDRSGQVPVLPDCTLPGHPEVFVVGDLMSLDQLPGVAEVAMQSGHYAAKVIERRVRGRDGGKPFRYVDLGTMATIARFRAVVYVGRIRVAGFPGWLLWLFVHLAFLTGFKNRFAAVADWLVAFLGRGRRQRTITEQQLFARERALAPDADTGADTAGQNAS